MIGPNRRATEAVPKRCTAKRATMIARVMGITRSLMEEEIVSVPSTAESTEIAGVIMLSPKKSAAPNTPEACEQELDLRRDLLPDLADLRDQRHDPALAFAVGGHHQADLLDGDDQHHRPEDQRDDAVDALKRRLDRMRIARVERCLDRVDRAGPDVTEDHPESADDQRRLAHGARHVGVHPPSLCPPARGADGGITARSRPDRSASDRIYSPTPSSSRRLGSANPMAKGRRARRRRQLRSGHLLRVPPPPGRPDDRGCMLIHQLERAGEVLRAYRDYVDEGPDELATALALFPAPPEPFIPEHLQGKTVLGIIACHCGELEVGKRVVGPLKGLGP